MVHLRDPYHCQYPLTFWLIAWMMGQSTSSESPQAIQRCEQVNVLPVRGAGWKAEQRGVSGSSTTRNVGGQGGSLLGRNNPSHWTAAE